MPTTQDGAARLRSRFDAGETVLGCFLSLGSPITAEIMGAAGYDCAIIDLEHGAGNEQDALRQMQALAISGCTSFVRVESTERQRVHRMLDFGAHGIMFPRVDSVAQAEAAVAAMRYPPTGVRGVASSNRACAYGTNFRPYIAGSSNLYTMVQIESGSALEQVDLIAAVNGVDMLFLGPWDLSFAMGILGEFNRPEFAEALRRTAEAASKRGKQSGILLPAGYTVADCHALGYRFIVAGADVMLLDQAARVLVRSLQDQRSQLPE